MEFIPQLTGEVADALHPSLFEILSEQQLSALLPPTLRYLVVLLTQRYPRHLLRLLNRFDEVYLLASLVVERHYLLTRGGTFTEAFYGLKRERAAVAAGGHIPRAQAKAPGTVRDSLAIAGSRRLLWANLAAVVLLPYLRRRLDEAHELDAPRARMGLGFAGNRPPGRDASARERVAFYWRRYFLRRAYPALNAAGHVAAVAFSLAYLAGKTRYQNPALWLAGTRIRRMGPADYAAIEKLGKRTAGEAGAEAAKGLAGYMSVRALGAGLLGALGLALPASIFALKFLEWWHASDFARQLSRRAAETLALPPPVLAGYKGEEPQEQAELRTTGSSASGSKDGVGATNTSAPGASRDAPAPARMVERVPPIARGSLLPIFTVPPPRDSALCPICEADITTATACQTGVVFCYGCIHRWLEGVHPRQDAFMEGGDGAGAAEEEREGGEGQQHQESAWAGPEDEKSGDAEGGGANNATSSAKTSTTRTRTVAALATGASRVGKWESGLGRCAVTGRRVLGGVEGLRRIMV